MDYAVPTASELIRAFGCSVADADRVVEILTDAAPGGWRDIQNALEDAGEILKIGTATAPMDYSITHPEGYGEYSSDRVGWYIEGDTYDTTLAYLNGDYLSKERTYDHSKQEWVPAPRKEGFYVTSWGHELEQYENLFTEGMSKREMRDYEEWLGPRDGDLWTRDYRTWWSYVEYRKTTQHPEAFVLNLRESQRCPVCYSFDTYVDSWDGDGNRNYPWECRDCSHSFRAPLAPYTVWEDDPSDFYDDHEDAIWRMISKWQDKEGYYGNVWTTDKRGEEWRILDPPSSARWNKSEEWRIAYRLNRIKKLFARKRAELGPRRSPERARQGLPMPVTKQHGRPYTNIGRRRALMRHAVISRRVPVTGDLYHAGRGASGEVYFYRVGDNRRPALVVTEREIQLGIAHEKVRRAAKTGIVWRARGGDILDWTPVVLDRSQGFAGLRRRRR